MLTGIGMVPRAIESVIEELIHSSCPSMTVTLDVKDILISASQLWNWSEGLSVAVTNEDRLTA